MSRDGVPAVGKKEELGRVPWDGECMLNVEEWGSCFRLAGGEAILPEKGVMRKLYPRVGSDAAEDPG